MGKFALALAALFLSSLVLSGASDFPENDVSTGDLASEMSESTPVILLPSEFEDSTGSKIQENELRTVESKEEVTTVTFRPEDNRLDGPSESPVGFRFPYRHRRPCRHGRRPFNPSDLTSRGREIPYGNDMILATEKLDSDSESSEDLTPRPRFHHHHHHHHHDGENELEGKGQTFRVTRHGDVDQDLDHHGRKRFHHGHRLSEREDDEREDNEREEKEEEEHHHHRHHHQHHHEEDEEGEEHHHHHHHHRRHHHEEAEEEEKGGFLMKFRKFLTDRS